MIAVVDAFLRLASAYRRELSSRLITGCNCSAICSAFARHWTGWGLESDIGTIAFSDCDFKILHGLEPECFRDERGRYHLNRVVIIHN